MAREFQTKILIVKERFSEAKRKGKIAGYDNEFVF